MKEFLEMIEDAKLDFVGSTHIMNRASGEMRRMKNGNLKMTIELPPEVMIEGLKGIPFLGDGWALEPVIVFFKKRESK